MGWQLCDIRANISDNGSKIMKKRTFGIQYFYISNLKENSTLQQQTSFGLVVFICKASKNLCDDIAKQITSIIQERKFPFILCFEQSDSEDTERNAFLLKDIMKSLRSSLRKTHTIIGTEPLLGKSNCLATLNNDFLINIC